MSEPKVRLADIAKDTGYSLATVSKALNGRSDISDEARAAIDLALKATGYQRRGQKTKRGTLRHVSPNPKKDERGCILPTPRWRNRLILKCILYPRFYA